MQNKIPQSFFDTTPLGFYQTTPDGRIITANRAFKNMLGIQQKQLSKINLNEYLLGTEYSRKNFVHKIKKNDEIVGFEYEWRKRDGSIRYVRENAHVVRNRNKILYYEGTVEDITDRKLIELELLESQKNLTEVQNKLNFLDSMSRQMTRTMDYARRLKILSTFIVPQISDWCAIDILDEHGDLKTLIIRHMNKNKLALAKELKKKYPPEPKRSGAIWDVIQSGTPLFIPKVTSEMIEKSAKDKTHASLLKKIDLHSLLILPLISRRKTMGVITLANSERNREFNHSDLLFAEHITTRAAMNVDNARMYNEVLEDEKRRDHFLGIASHELKNALSGIKSYTQLLERKIPAVDKNVAYLRKINANTDRLKRLMDDLIDLTKLKSQKLTLVKSDFDLNDLLRDTVEELQTTTKTHKIVFKSVSPISVIADRVRIRQVIVNLVKNAIKYSPEAKRIVVSLKKLGAEFFVSIKDFGLGIEKKDQRKIFDLFYRADEESTKTSGLGVGLYISNEIVKMHGGKMSLKSAPGKGSTFSFVLPLKP